MDYEGKLKAVNQHDIQIALEEDFNLTEARRRTDKGENIRLKVTVIDKRSITPKQQKFIHALFGDVSDYTGYPLEWVKDMFKAYYSELYNVEGLSLAMNHCNITQANQLIELIIEFCFQNDIPFHFKEYYQAVDIARLAFLFIKYRTCFICGKQHSDVDHVDAVGMGNNRNKIDHANRFYYCLCRTHHTERHTIGEIAFENKYHIKPILLNEEAVKELKIGK